MIIFVLEISTLINSLEKVCTYSRYFFPCLFKNDDTVNDNYLVLMFVPN